MAHVRYTRIDGSSETITFERDEYGVNAVKRAREFFESLRSDDMIAGAAFYSGADNHVETFKH